MSDVTNGDLLDRHARDAAAKRYPLDDSLGLTARETGAARGGYTAGYLDARRIDTNMIERAAWQLYTAKDPTVSRRDWLREPPHVTDDYRARALQMLHAALGRP